MFDREIIKAELQEVITAETKNVDLDAVIDNYTLLEGFYCFRIHNDAYIFNNNQLIDSFPGFYADLSGDDVGGQ